MTAAMDLDTLGSAKYVSLTTYRKDGTAIATPVWLARAGDTLLVVTDPTSGKVKRLRNNPTVLLSPCDMRGRVKSGAISAAGTVAIQDEAQTKQTVDVIGRKYGLMGRIFTRRNERKAKKAGKAAGHVGLTITLQA